MNTSVNYDRIEHRAKTVSTIRRTVVYALLGIWALIVLFPFYWMIL